MICRTLIAASAVTLVACLASLAEAGAYSDAVLADSPVAYYRLEETMLSVAANSSTEGALLDGTFEGGYSEAPEGTDPLTIGQAGPRPGDMTGSFTIVGFETDNRAIRSGIAYLEEDPETPGPSPRVEVPDFAGNPLDITGELTLEAWVFPEEQTEAFSDNNEGIVQKYLSVGSQRAYELVRTANTGQLAFILSRFGVYESKFDLRTEVETPAAPMGEWTYVAATYVPGTRMAIFANGELVIERTDPAGIPDFLLDGTAPLWIGNQLHLGNPTTVFEGRIDEAAVYNTALSDATILAHYQAAASMAPPILAGDYNGNGIVDAADYTEWRDNLGSNDALPNDPIGGTIGQAHYDQWKTNFGTTLGTGAGSLAAVPEPTAMGLFLFGLLLTSASRLRCVVH